MTRMLTSRACWCGNADLSPFSSEYGSCEVCGTLVKQTGRSNERLKVVDDDRDFYGKQYWLDHQTRDLGFPDIHQRARNDLTERNLHWLRALLARRLPPARVLELGCAHGSFVALLRQAGYDAIGVEMSPWVVEFARETFGIPVAVGPVDALDIPDGSLDVIASMDVLEHLPEPATTMARCLQLLKPDGILLIQAPQFDERMKYQELVETQGVFLEQMKPEKEHLYLFSDRSVTLMFKRLGAGHLQFEPAIFSQYDMFFAVSRAPLVTRSDEESAAALKATPHGRLTLALLDISARESLVNTRLQASEADRAALLAALAAQGEHLNRLPQLEAEKDRLAGHGDSLQRQLDDRAARLGAVEAHEAEQFKIISQIEVEKNRLAARVDSLQQQLADLRSRWLVKVSERLKP